MKTLVALVVTCAFLAMGCGGEKKEEKKKAPEKKAEPTAQVKTPDRVVAEPAPEPIEVAVMGQPFQPAPARPHPTPPPAPEPEPVQVWSGLDSTYENIERIASDLPRISATVKTAADEYETCYGDRCETLEKEARTQVDNLRRNKTELAKTIRDYRRMCAEAGRNAGDHPKPIGTFEKRVAEAEQFLSEVKMIADGD